MIKPNAVQAAQGKLTAEERAAVASRIEAAEDDVQGWMMGETCYSLDRARDGDGYILSAARSVRVLGFGNIVSDSIRVRVAAGHG